MKLFSARDVRHSQLGRPSLKICCRSFLPPPLLLLLRRIFIYMEAGDEIYAIGSDDLLPASGSVLQPVPPVEIHSSENPLADTSGDDCE